MLDATAVMADVTGAEDDFRARLALWAEPDRISFRMLCTLPSFSLFTCLTCPPLPRGSLSPLALALVETDGIWASVVSVWVFLPRPRPALKCLAGGLGGLVEEPSWMVSTVRRGCFLGRPRFLLGGAWTVRLSVLV